MAIDFRKKLKYLPDLLIGVLFLLYFRANLIWTAETLFRANSYEYAFLFVAALAAIVFFLKDKFVWASGRDGVARPSVFIPFFAIILLDLMNVYFWHYQILSAGLMMLGGYILLGMYLKRDIWKRGFYMALIIAFSLPFAEHLQTFLGFPLRLFTAKIVSFIMELTGVANVPDSSVIITENNATSIDVPCSGIKSIYTGLIAVLIVFYAKNVRINIRIIAAVVAFFLLLFFTNVWRVFSLVYIADVLEYPSFADAVHVGIGLAGFALSVVFLWFVIDKVADRKREDRPFAAKEILAGGRKKHIIILLIVATLADTSFLLFAEKNPVPANENITFTIYGYSLEKADMSEKEKNYFNGRDVIYSEKFTGEMPSSRGFSLLLVSSKSWRSQHNPEICLQGMGYSIESSEIMQADNFRFRKLAVVGGNAGSDGTVIYWFTNGKKNLLDYSERVWEGWQNSSDTWTLVEIGFPGNDFDPAEVRDLIFSVQEAVTKVS